MIDAIIFILEDKKVLGVFFNKKPRNLFMKPSYFKIPCLVSWLLTLQLNLGQGYCKEETRRAYQIPISVQKAPLGQPTQCWKKCLWIFCILKVWFGYWSIHYFSRFWVFWPFWSNVLEMKAVKFGLETHQALLLDTWLFMDFSYWLCYRFLWLWPRINHHSW